jgi:hypothetical protein
VKNYPFQIFTNSSNFTIADETQMTESLGESLHSPFFRDPKNFTAFVLSLSLPLSLFFHFSLLSFFPSFIPLAFPPFLPFFSFYFIIFTFIYSVYIIWATSPSSPFSFFLFLFLSFCDYDNSQLESIKLSS